MSGTRLVKGLGLALDFDLDCELIFELGLDLDHFLFFPSINICDMQALCRHIQDPRKGKET